MTRPTNPNGRSRNVDENLNKSDLSTSNNKTTSTSKNQTAPPTLRSIAENNGVKLYPFIQQGEYKRGFKYEVQHGLKIHETPDVGF